MLAGIVVGLVALQIVLAVVSFGIPALGVLHGINGLAIAGVAGMASAPRRDRASSPRPVRKWKGRLIALGVTLAVSCRWRTSGRPAWSRTTIRRWTWGTPTTAAARRRAGHQHHGGKSVADLTGPRTGKPDVAVTLTAKKQKFTLASGESIDGFTLNGTSPGPLIRAKQGRPRRGHAGQRVRTEGRDAALARDRRTQRGGRGRRGHAGRGTGGWEARLPVPRRGDGDLLVPLASGFE